VKPKKNPTRRGAKPAKAKAKAARLVAHKPQKTEGTRTRELEERVAEALEQQAATSEILRVISQSQTDTQPVFDTIVRSAVKLCHGLFSGLLQFDGETLHHVAHHNFSSEALDELNRIYPARPSRALGSGRAILERAVVHVPDVELDPEWHARALSRAIGFRSGLFVPMLREGAPIGVIVVTRAEPGPFSDNEIELLKTFADQAVIAVENVRLFKELEARNRDLTEALEQQTATAEILRVISSSPTDVQPVFDAIAANAARLSGATDAIIRRVDGDALRLVAHHGALPGMGPDHLMPLDRGSIMGRSVVDRQTVHVHDFAAHPKDELPVGQDLARRFGYRTALAVPLLREGVAIGSIGLRRLEVLPFSDQQIKLLETFADQAVIAIENAGLFAQLQARNRDLTEALEQQRATSEILRAISASPTDLQPVLDAVVKSAARFCGADDTSIFRVDGEHLRAAAHHGPVPQPMDLLLPIVRGTLGGRTVLERRPIQVANLQAETDEFPEASAFATQIGFRAALSVPLVREGAVIGVIQLRRTEVDPFTDKQTSLLQAFADQAVIAIENVRLFTELQEKNRALTFAHEQVTEALEKQTATSEILRTIAHAQTDAQPVFDTIVRSATGLCKAAGAGVFLTDGKTLYHPANYGGSPEALAAARARYPRPLDTNTTSGMAILTRSVVQVPDIEEPSASEHARQVGQGLRIRSFVSVPMLREGEAVGAINVIRRETGLFSDAEVELLKTFADQAVIAVENVRLFKELEARNRDLSIALEQKTATGEILRVISSSPTDVQPVFDAIASSAARLCDCLCGLVFRFDGEMITLAGDYGSSMERLEAIRAAYPATPNRMSVAAQAILERRVIAIADAQSSLEYPHRAERAKAIGYRSVLSVPMLRGDTAIGAINVIREEAIPFSDTQTELLKTFADQAVIAIENVRLFKELEGRNRDLTEALEQQTATAEILRVISRSQTDVQPVFDTIVRSAVKLCDGLFSALYQFDGELIHHVAHHNYTPEALEAVRRMYPARPTRALLTGRTILARAIVHIPDVQVDPEYQYQAMPRAIGWRSGLFVPMLREGAPIGVIFVARAEAGPFSDNEIELLKTFADQAVIAVENVRLFKELQARTGELTQSVEKLTALGEVSRAVSSTLDVETVLDTIVSRASQLAGGAGCSIFEYDAAAQQFELRATHNDDTEFVEALRAVPLRKGEGLMGRAAEMREPIQIPDIAQPGAYESSVRDTLIRFGYHALLAVPLLREDQIIGSLSFNNTDGDTYVAMICHAAKMVTKDRAYTL
jgi:GAF domain-containing protein